MPSPTVPADFTSLFYRQIGNPDVYAELFDSLPAVYFFMKDRLHRFVRVNRALATLMGCSSPSQMIAKTDFDFNAPVLAAQYTSEDRLVMSSGKPLLNQVWLVRGADGLPCWYRCSKFPVTNAAGKVIGLAGVLCPYEQTGESPREYQRLTAACDFVLAHYSQPIAISDLAAKANLSLSQFQREFRRLFASSPSEYLLRVRLLMARRALEQSNSPVGRIALDCGFYDQSHFTKAFRAATGLSPLRYRNRFAPGAG